MRSRHAVQKSVPAALALTALLAVCAPAFAQPLPSSDAERSTKAQRCRDLFTKGFEAINASRFDAAREVLSEAFRDCPSYDVAGALGQAELELGRYRDAAEHLDYAVSTFPPGESRELLAKTKEGLERAKRYVGTVRVVVSHPGAEVSVDDRPVGVSPLTRELFVETGQHRVRSAKEGASAAEESFEARPGQYYALELKLGEISAPGNSSQTPSANTGPSTEAPSFNHQSGMPSRTIVLIGGGALTAVLLGVAGVYHLKGNSADDDAASLRMQAHAELGDNCPENSGNPTCQQLADALDRRNSSNTVATVSLVGAGVSAAATVALYFLLPKPAGTADSAKLHFSVGASRRGTSLLVGTSF